MERVVLITHLILALSLIGVVLMQRSEGGGLGMGGGGGGGGIMSARGAATALGKVTWILAIGFICTSIGLTIISAEKSATASVVDRATTSAPATDGATDAPAAPAGDSLGTDLLPPTSGDTPLVPFGN
jgi:preprotein translocase subunit SecG